MAAFGDFTVAEIDAALVASGYTDNQILTAKFDRLNKGIGLIYKITYRDGLGKGSGEVIVFNKDGKTLAEFWS